MLDQNARDNHETTSVMPTTRDAFLAEWREDPQAILDQSREFEMTLDSYSRARAPATAESPGSTLEWLLFNEGIRMVDTFDLESSLMQDLPDIDPQKGEPDPLARAMIGYWDECYNKTLMTGERNAQAISTLTTGGPWRPRYDESPIRVPQIAPGFNFLDVVAYTRRIREDKYRIPEWKNAKSEQIMQEVAEGTEPKLFEITRADREVSMRNYRAGIEATDSFLNDNQTRARDITNAIEEIAIGHRIALLTGLAKLIHDSTPSGNVYTVGNTAVAGVTPDGGRLGYPFWTKFLKDFGNAYIPNVTLGNKDAITNLELMSMTAGDQNITYGSWTMVPNTNIRNLNGNMTEMSYGWIDDDTTTGFGNTELFTFQRETTVAYIQRMGMDQDEMERVPGPRKTRRWLGTQSAFALIDPNGLRSINFA